MGMMSEPIVVGSREKISRVESVSQAVSGSEGRVEFEERERLVEEEFVEIESSELGVLVGDIEAQAPFELVASKCLK